MLSKKSVYYLILLLLFVVFTFDSFSKAINYLKVKPLAGDGIFLLFKRYSIPYEVEIVRQFKLLNQSRFDRNGNLLVNTKYKLPIQIVKYNGKSIRSSIHNNNYQKAKSIEEYNDLLFSLNSKSNNFRDDKILWVPLFKLTKINRRIIKKKFVKQNLTFPIFGDKYKNIITIDNKLENCVFYLVSGHGGPDPGAIGKIGNIVLSEDEYAYDITLRLARRLIEHSAKVYIVVQDPNDGIRDEKFLNNSHNEFYFGGFTIDRDQKIRLGKRANIINKLYRKNLKKHILQRMIVTHVDSRSYDKKIDIFFYYSPGSTKGKSLANFLQETIKHKYQIAQPNRLYRGSVSTRNLFILNKTIVPGVFIELGNIRNAYDRQRLILNTNRQAIAYWLCDGLIEYKKTH